MAPIVVEGNTLGEIHRNYNKLVIDAVHEKAIKEIENINYDDPDFDNLFKIDYACRTKNVDYVLETFKCKDVLYCSKAIKGSTWLITDPQYSHIINAGYLFTKLFPEMMTIARNKLLLHIRLNLRDEERAQGFFMHLKECNIDLAVKWLPYCSTSFIVENIAKHVANLSLPVIMRLSEISLNFLHIYCNTEYNYNRVPIYIALRCGMRYANNDIEKYFDIIDSVENHNRPLINPKTTKLIMEKCPQRILDHLEKYIDYIDIATFAKFIKGDKIEDFLEQCLIKENLTTRVGREIEHLILRLPEKDRFEFVREHFIDTKNKKHLYIGKSANLKNIYIWYRFAAFDEAFNDLKKLIRIESNPGERLAMILIIITCAGNSLKHINKLLKYYRAHHINEPFIYKVKFVNTLLDVTKPYTFDEETWRILNDIFISMEVYSESEHDLQSCVNCVMLYKIINNDTIPENITLKFNFNTFKTEQHKLNRNDREKVFEYLWNYANKELDKRYEQLTKNNEFEKVINWIDNTLDLLVDWNKDLANYPKLLIKIKDLSKYSQENISNAMLKSIYHKSKSWRKLLFDESILFDPSENTLINVLKHNPELIHSNKEEMEALFLNDKQSVKQLLRKLRIYKAHFANDLKELYYKNIEQKGGLRSTIIGLCILLPSNDLSLLINRFIPVDEKINWDHMDEQRLSLQKHLAKNMHRARPQPPLSSILLYAKGDYLQYVLPSLSSTLHNITSSDLRKEILNKIICTPVSLQKHIIREAFTKFQFDELLTIFSSVWETIKNSSIRATIFMSTFNLLCRETNMLAIERIWSVLNTFIDDLTVDENKIIFVTLGQVSKVPIQIRPAFCIKSYKMLKRLPERSNSAHIMQQVITSTIDIMEFMDADFMTEVFMELYEAKIFQNDDYHFIIDVISAFLLSTQNELSQKQRFEYILLPLLENVDTIWTYEKDNFRKTYVEQLLNRLLVDIENVVIKKNMLMPITLFRHILNELEEKLPFEENYMLITRMKLAHAFITILDSCIKNNPVDYNFSCDRNTENTNYTKSENKISRNIYVDAFREFSKTCLQYLIKDAKCYGTSVIVAYGEALNKILDGFTFCDSMMQIELCKAILDCSEAKEGFLLVLRILQQHLYYDLPKETLMELIKRVASHSDSEVKIFCSTLKNDPNFLT